MKSHDGRLSASPTDLANFLACRHKTSLDRRVAEGELDKPMWTDPLAKVLQDRGQEHERRYVDALRAQGLFVVDLGEVARDDRPARTVDAMCAGADVIVQAALANDRWLGYADVLRKVDVPCPVFGAWSYEAHDTKLSRETRGGTILQLCVYTELIGEIQGHVPERIHVVTPAGTETLRFDDFAAFHRGVKAQFEAFAAPTYPEPTEHCAVCRWWPGCNAERREGDHLSFVSGLGRQHQTELAAHGVTTLAGLAAIPVPLAFKPSRGSKGTYERLREQARLQVAQRDSGQPTFEPLAIEMDFGLTQLPEPCPGDLFLDLEGDPFGRPASGLQPGEGGREYLFGLGRLDANGRWTYAAKWAFSDADEREGFDWAMAEIMAALESDPAIHVYHYAPYEPTAFKRLMGRYAARQADVDRLLRGRRFVDLYAIVRHAIRAGVESYSIKALEPFYGFMREVELDEAGDQRRLVEVAIETGDVSGLTPEIRATVEGYNRDDCRSTLELRDWLERLRAEAIAKGAEISRPPLEPVEPNEEVRDKQQRVNELRARLLEGDPPNATDRTPEQHARYLLAYLLDWHAREDKVVWWEYYRLLGLSDEDLTDEANAVAGLEFVERVDVVRNKKTGKPTSSVVDRYTYPLQECEIRPGGKLKRRDDTLVGEVVGIDRVARTLDVKKSRGVADIHPASAFVHEHVPADQPASALFRLGEQVADGGLESASAAARDLLLRCTAQPPAGGPGALAIQGPPGSGKTFTGARMICELVAHGKRVGVTATGHKVIRNLLEAVAAQSAGQVRLGHKAGDVRDDAHGPIHEFGENGAALTAIAGRQIDVLGGTAWLWARPEFAGAVDVLFIDEAGQMSLANALAVSQAAPNLVLLGDPQQLEQPQKGSHPDGVGASALDHVLEGHQTMPENRGQFLPVTWRLPPRICEFTSEVFYERKLTSKPGLERQRLVGAGRFTGSGLFVVEVAHDGCRNASDEEATVVAGIVRDLTASGVHWIDEDGREHQMTPADILVVAPYNAHVGRLQQQVPGFRGSGFRGSAQPWENPEPRNLGTPEPAIGTVDKFQGQEAPVVIYSMATSRPEDAPRGMEFLYSLNRFNVATSRAKCACILVASPRLFEPECRTPRQMRLANALARYRELAEGPAPGQ